MPEPLILVSDDNQEIRDFLQEVLVSLGGYRVEVVGDGMSALSLIKELAPDLVITDQQMPNLTGTELIRRLKADLPVLPVILMTGESSESLTVEAIRVGAVDYLVKPFDPDTLLDSVTRALTRGRMWKDAVDGFRGEKHETRSLDHKETDELAKMAGSTMEELDEVLSAAVNTAVRLTGAEEGSLLLLDEATGELYMRASKNFEDEFAGSFRILVQDSLAGQVIESGEPVILDEQSPQKIKTSYLVHSLAYVPLKIQGKTIGVLGVDNQSPDRTLSEKDQAILMAIGDYAALAIENAQLLIRSEAERHQLETILAGVENGVIVIDTENRILILNETARSTLKIEANPVGMDSEELLKDPKLISLLNSEMDLVQREEIELIDGRVFSALRTPIEGVGQAIVMQDVTYLKELDRIKSEFVTTVSHDLRSPLTAILGYIELIERAGETSEQQKEFIRRIQLSVKQISMMISDLLDLGRIEAGLDTTKEITEMTGILKQVLHSIEGAAGSSGVMVETTIPDDLGKVFGDPVRLRQLITNLLDNAIKYTPTGGKVDLSAHAEDNQVILEITDTGPGIEQDDLPHLFERFFRGSNVSEDMPGTGLGLAIVKSILDSHNGRIWVDSQVGEGTTFTVVFPTFEE